MNIKWSTIAAMTMLPSVFTVCPVVAAPYQLQATGYFSKFEYEITRDDRKSETDSINGSVTYYLQPVDIQTGPLLQRAFLDKAAFVTGTYIETKPDQGRNPVGVESFGAETFGLEGRFVTATDFIIDYGYKTTDTDLNTDSNTTTIGVGKYLDGQTTAVLTYEKVDAGSDRSTISGNYRTLTSNESNGTSFSTGLSLRYIDTNADSGYGFSGFGAYYLSYTTAVGLNVVYEKIGDADTTVYSLNGNYFFTANIFAGASYTVNSTDVLDGSSVLLSVGARF